MQFEKILKNNLTQMSDSPKISITDSLEVYTYDNTSNLVQLGGIPLNIEVYKNKTIFEATMLKDVECVHIGYATTTPLIEGEFSVLYSCLVLGIETALTPHAIISCSPSLLCSPTLKIGSVVK